MITNFADRLMEAIQDKKVPACVGLDPVIERLPPAVLDAFDRPDRPTNGHRSDIESVTKAILAYGREVIQIIAPHVPAIKINIAFFEPYYAKGISAYFELVREAKDAGLIVIGDVKRADIGHSSSRYAAAQLDGSGHNGVVTPDAVTVNAYFGSDTLVPFADIARDQERGVFVLVQTSNPSAAEVQGLVLSDGSTVCERVGMMVQRLAADAALVGASGYSSIGAVVSPRDLPSTDRLRALMPHCLFLVPGFGAQGRTADEVAHCFKSDGTGAIITASRSVIYAYQAPKHDGDGDWKRCVDQACRDLVCAIRNVVPSV